MKIYIAKNGPQAGPFEENQVLEGIRTGQLSPDDLAIREGGTEWLALRSLFPDKLQTESAPETVAVSANNPVQEWAARNLKNPVEVILAYNSVVTKVFMGLVVFLLAAMFFGLPLMGIYNRIKQGKSFSAPLIFLLTGTGVLVLSFLLARYFRGKIVKVLNEHGVVCRNGSKFQWSELISLNYKNFQTKISGNRTLSSTNAAIYKNFQKVKVEMIFKNGKAFIAPLIENQAEILALMESMPVPKNNI